MRLSVFLALVIATFVVVASADNAAIPASERNLRALGLSDLAGKADDIAGAVTHKSDDIAANFLQTLRKKAMLTRADNAEKAGKLGAAAGYRRFAGDIARLNKGQKAQLSEMVKLAKSKPEKAAEIAVEVAKKDPKKWSTMKKVLVGVLGVSVFGGIIYYATHRSTQAPATE